jgi:hypothetical protein
MPAGDEEEPSWSVSLQTNLLTVPYSFIASSMFVLDSYYTRDSHIALLDWGNAFFDRMAQSQGRAGTGSIRTYFPTVSP